MKKKVAILISGRGSNMAALIKATRAPDYPAKIVKVISNNPEAAGLQTAQKENIPVETISHKEKSREQFEENLHNALIDAGTELICLAGFMRILSAGFVGRWPEKILNIHPSLLPAFKGTDVYRRTLDAGVSEAGCTVHIVSPEVDSGPVILQRKVPVLPDDTEKTLAARILEQEHLCYPQALKVFIENNFILKKENVA